MVVSVNSNRIQYKLPVNAKEGGNSTPAPFGCFGEGAPTTPHRHPLGKVVKAKNNLKKEPELCYDWG